MAKAKVGSTICSLDDLIFPVELRDNDRNIAAPEKRRETDSKVLEYMLEYA